MKNKRQDNADGDELGDECDVDIDGDGLNNEEDNCPYFYNQDQTDSDNDGVGNVCDNCINDSNPDQDDKNKNNIGDACDDSVDKDQDGIPDSIDNCPRIPNADQLDNDQDGQGDECDDDIDGDGLNNAIDNCPLVPNPDQKDGNEDGLGDVCTGDMDGDHIEDNDDTCPLNGKIKTTDFRNIQPISMGENEYKQKKPEWQFKNDGKEIIQLMNSAPGIAVGKDRLAGVNMEATLHVGKAAKDDDWIGIVFSFQVYFLHLLIFKE